MTRLKINSDRLEWRDVEGEIVALDLGAREYVSINKTGATIWPLLAAGATPKELAEKLVDEFGIEVGTATRDADAFVGQLRERGLLEET